VRVKATKNSSDVLAWSSPKHALHAIAHTAETMKVKASELTVTWGDGHTTDSRGERAKDGTKFAVRVELMRCDLPRTQQRKAVQKNDVAKRVEPGERSLRIDQLETKSAAGGVFCARASSCAAPPTAAVRRRTARQNR
jgi:hypothetical protein